MGHTIPEYAIELEQIKQIIPVSAQYFHYKNSNQTYTIISHGIIEATLEPAIIYQADYDTKIIWIRPVSNFLEEIEYEAEKVPRFTRIQ